MIRRLDDPGPITPANADHLAAEALAMLDSVESLHPQILGSHLPDELADDRVRIRHAALILVSVALTLADPLGDDFDTELGASTLASYWAMRRLGVDFAEPFTQYMKRLAEAMGVVDDDREPDPTEDDDDGGQDDPWARRAFIEDRHAPDARQRQAQRRDPMAWLDSMLCRGSDLPQTGEVRP